MATYRVRLELRSGLGTPLAADTLWGHLAWGLRWHRGEDALRDWLAEYEAGRPPLMLSDPLPADHLPRPRVPLEEPESTSVRKQLRRVDWIRVDDRLWRGAINARELSASLSRAAEEPAIGSVEETSELHAAVNRLTGGTAQEGGGTLFGSVRAYYSPNQRFDVWCVSNEGMDEIARLFHDGLLCGYGRDAASGSGDLRVATVEEVTLPQPTTAPNAVLLLAAARPRSQDPSRGFTPFEMRCGRLGGDFAMSCTPSGSTERQKRPILMLSRGAVLLTSGSPQSVGGLVGGVHEDPAIRHYAAAPCLPLTLGDDILAMEADAA